MATYLKIGVTHLYAESLGLVATRNGTAIVAREHDDGTPLEIGAEDALTRGIEVITVGKGKHRYIFFMV